VRGKESRTECGRATRLPSFMIDAKQDDDDQRKIRSSSLLYTQSLPLRQLSLVLAFGWVVLEMLVPQLVDLIASHCWPGCCSYVA